jgi:molybdate transport system ATP-binding protein
MNVLENIEIGLISNNQAANNLLSKEYIERLGLKDLEKQYPWQLSGGQQQRVALGRALITEPDILLLDEPFSALDYHLRLNMEKELLSILKAFNGQVIFVTHDIEEAYRISDNIIVFDKGIATLSRDKNDLFKNPKTLAEATLTGCKNISKATKIDPYTIYAENWGIEYHFTKIIPDSISHIGIRAHYIEIMSSNEDEDTYPFIVENIIENPFDFSVYVRTLNNERCDIVNFFIDKRKLNFSINERVFVKFPEASVFYF